MSKNATGAAFRLLALTQAVWGALPADPVAEVLYTSAFELTDSQPEEQDPTLGSGFRGQAAGVKGRVDVSGTASVVIGTSIGPWLKHLIGAPTTTGSAGAYVHTFAVGTGANALPAALMLEGDFGARIGIPGRYIRNRDVRIGSASFALSSSTTLQTATFNLVGGSKRTLPAAPVDETPQDFGHRAFALADMTLQLDGGATEVCVESWNIEWNNDLDTDLYCLNDGGQRHDLPEGQAIITGTGVAQFDTAALLAKAEAGEDLAVQVRFRRGSGNGTAGNEELTLNVPLSSFQAPTPGVTGPRGIKQNFNFTAYRPTGGEVGVTAVLKVPRATI